MGSIASISPTDSDIIVNARRLLLAAVAFFVAICRHRRAHAQSGPFAGMAGNWSGGGTITLDDGSSERIRCRATYAVGAGGNGLNQTLTCASDSYKFNLASNVIAQGGSAVRDLERKPSATSAATLRAAAAAAISRWSPARAGFTANISLTTRGNKQSVIIKSEGAFRVTSISLSRS